MNDDQARTADTEILWNDRDSGRVRLPDHLSIEFARQDGDFQLYASNALDPRGIAEAGAALREARPNMRVVVSAVSPPAAVLGRDVSEGDLVERLRETLLLGLAIIGVSNHDRSTVFTEYGSGSEFRGFLGDVRKFAMRTLVGIQLARGRDGESVGGPLDDRAKIAAEIVLVTSAVAFAMRDPIRVAWTTVMADGITALEDVGCV